MTTLYKGALSCALALMFAGMANAATLNLDFSVSFGTTPADGPAPWLTGVLDDGGTPGSVTLTLQVASTVGAADITQVYLNLDPSLDATDLSFSLTGGTGPTPNSVDLGADAFKADGDGLYDILIDLPPPPGNLRFEAGETLVFDITGIAGLTASDFNVFATPDGGAGPFIAAAKVQSTGPLECNDPINGCPPGEFENLGSDWIGVVPVPGAVWLFGSALVLLGWVRRKTA